MAPTFTQGDTAAGSVTFNGVCITCHQADGKGNKDLHAPPIAQQSDWYLVAQLNKFHAGWRGTNPEDIYGAQMRAMALTLADTTAMHNVVAYVKTLPH
jgi:cytochrome c oxidase subunit 2